MLRISLQRFAQYEAAQRGEALNRARFFQRLVSAVFVNCLHPARSHPYPHKFLQLRHPNALVLKIWHKHPGHHLGDVPADAALFFGQTAAMNDAASPRS
jgi:hypothetical protein